MLPTFIYHFLTITASLSVILFIIYYLTRIHAKEKELEERSKKIDTEYHKIVDNALSKERKILEDATAEADKIITGAQYVSTTSKESVDQALTKMVEEIESESDDTGKKIINSYQASLKEISGASLKNFESISKTLEDDLQKQLKAFNDAQLADMQKSVEEYKQNQLKQTQEMVSKIVSQVSQEVLNKTITLDDHQKLVIDSFEKAKKEGLFG